MSDVNHVVIGGRLVKDCVLRTLPSGTSLCEFSVANNRGWGEHEKVHFFDVKFWGKGATAISKYLVKGKRVAVSGELQQERWEKDGSTKSKVVISTFEVFLYDGGEKASSEKSSEPEYTVYDEATPGELF